MEALSTRGRNLADIFIILNSATSTQAPQLLEEMGEYLSRFREFTHLQLRAALAAASRAEGVPREFQNRLLYYETRMLGLMYPAVLVASVPVAPNPLKVYGDTRVTVLFVGTPVPSPGELRTKNHLRLMLARREVAMWLLSARNAAALKNVLAAGAPQINAAGEQERDS